MNRHSLILFFFLLLAAFKGFAQDSPSKIVQDAYFECFGRAANAGELDKWTNYLGTTNAHLNDLIPELVKNIKNNNEMQQEISRQAYIDAFGSDAQTGTGSCLSNVNNEATDVLTYQALLSNLKDCLSDTALQLKAIQRSYNDYFGLQLDTSEKKVKSIVNNAIADGGLLYKTLMEQHRLYIIEAPEEQKAIINRSFDTVFGRKAKTAEMDSWFKSCRNAGCSYTGLSNQLKEYKKTHSKPILVIAPSDATVAVYIRAGSGTNEACNCVGEKMYLVNAEEVNSYKVIVTQYNYQSNATTTTEYIIAPKQEKQVGCTKDLDCVNTLIYNVVKYTKM